MVVESTRASIEYQSDGLATEFAFPGTAVDIDTIQVHVDDVEVRNFAVTRAVDTGRISIRYPSTGAALASGSTINIRRVVPFNQPYDFVNIGGVLPENVERAYDRIVEQIQQLNESVGVGTGVPGASGIGEEVAFTIYYEATLPSSKYPNNDWRFKTYGSSDTQIWYQPGGPGVTALTPYRFESRRQTIGTPETGDIIIGPWSTPTLIGVHGETNILVVPRISFDYGGAGAPSDGEVVLRIATSPANVAPTSWEEAAGIIQICADYVDTDGLDVRNWATQFDIGDLMYLVVGDAIIQFSITDRRNDSTNSCIIYDVITVVVSSAGETWPSVDDAVQLSGFRLGHDAIGYERIYTLSNEDPLPSSKYPDNDAGFDEPPTVDEQEWTDDEEPTTVVLPYSYRAVRMVFGIKRTGDSIPADWRTPKRVNTYAAPASDAAAWEEIFTRSSEAALPEAAYPNGAWGYDQPGTAGNHQWYDNEPSTTADEPYIFIARRRISGAPEIGAGVADDWRTPTRRASLGIDGTDGVDGTFGAPGLNGRDGITIVVVDIFKRSASAPTDTDKPSGTATYVVSNGSLAIIDANGWMATEPSGANTLYRRRARVTATGDIAVVQPEWWSPPLDVSLSGPTGPQGDAGGIGPIGLPGAEGATGATGPRGFVGLTGGTGNTGAQGEDGDQGSQGDDGGTGPQGQQGATGNTGPRGEQGEQGEQGDTGAPGGAANLPATATQAEMEAGTQSNLRSMSPELVRQAIERSRLVWNTRHNLMLLVPSQTVLFTL